MAPSLFSRGVRKYEGGRWGVPQEHNLGSFFPKLEDREEGEEEAEESPESSLPSSSHVCRPYWVRRPNKGQLLSGKTAREARAERRPKQV